MVKLKEANKTNNTFFNPKAELYSETNNNKGKTLTNKALKLAFVYNTN